jgi:hypothetical protein
MKVFPGPFGDLDATATSLLLACHSPLTGLENSWPQAYA